MGSNMKVLHIHFYMNNKQRIGEKRLGAEATRMGKLWSMLEHFWSILELKIEDPGCQA
jgi:hypothetical protein